MKTTVCSDQTTVGSSTNAVSPLLKHYESSEIGVSPQDLENLIKPSEDIDEWFVGERGDVMIEAIERPYATSASGLEATELKTRLRRSHGNFKEVKPKSPENETSVDQDFLEPLIWRCEGHSYSAKYLGHTARICFDICNPGIKGEGGRYWAFINTAPFMPRLVPETDYEIVHSKGDEDAKYIFTSKALLQAAISSELKTAFIMGKIERKPKLFCRGD